MGLKHILGHPNWDPNQLGGPPSSNHGPPSWAPLQNPSWLHSSLCVNLLLHRHHPLLDYMAVSALVESERCTAATSHHHLSGQPGGATMPMSLLKLALIGIGEAFQFPGQVSLYYQEFLTSLKSMATAMIGLIIRIAFYLSTAVIGCLWRVTGWLPDNIENGKVDYVF
ncbi:major facilitator superfamily protein [Actinidia rufa]|uniref:Major facilitator superfamily protein n=1 Tax=Actinidia rufa TaxID=165716 RepID=A0A7J0HBT0_9ERIC|nr:major facilitator superfamily protein [Actinidia rufa]